jgi:hypothetical protein
MLRPMWREKLRGLSRFGAGMLSAVLLTLFLVVFVPRLAVKLSGEIPAGDMLAYLGGMFGAAAAVAGALFIEEWKRSNDTRRSARMLLQTIDYLQSPVAQIERAHGEDLPPVRAHVLYSMGVFALLEAEPAFNHARELMRIEDFRLHEALRELSGEFDMARTHQARLREIRMDDDENILGMLDVTVFWVAVLKTRIDRAREALQDLT